MDDRMVESQEAAGEAACYQAAGWHGLTQEQADNCDDGGNGCPSCPWSKRPTVCMHPMGCKNAAIGDTGMCHFHQPRKRRGGPRPGFGGKQPGAGRKAGPVTGPRSVKLQAATVVKLDALRGSTDRAAFIQSLIDAAFNSEPRP